MKIVLAILFLCVVCACCGCYIQVHSSSDFTVNEICFKNFKYYVVTHPAKYGMVFIPVYTDQGIMTPCEE